MVQSNIARGKNAKSHATAGNLSGNQGNVTIENALTHSNFTNPKFTDPLGAASKQKSTTSSTGLGLSSNDKTIIPHTGTSQFTSKDDSTITKFKLPAESKTIHGTAKATNEPKSKAAEGASTTNDAGKMSPSRPSNLHSIIVSARQRGNPVLKHIRNVPWEFGDLVADYQMGQSTCALFLSLRYHNLNPNYIHERLKQLGHSYNLRVLLVQVDIKDPSHCLGELAKMCIMADCTLLLAFTAEEAGRYLETYKSFETKPPDLIMEKTEGNFMAKMTDALTTVKSVNKTDANTLLNTFGSLKKMVEASEEDLSFCPGFGPQKAKRLHTVFQEPFLREKKRKIQESPLKGSPTKLHNSKPGSSKQDPS